MKRVRFALLVLICVVILTQNCFASSVRDSSKEVFQTFSAESYLLMDADTGDVLSSRNPDHPLPMASTTKIMTCLIALEKGDINDKVKIPPAAVGIEGSSVYLVSGEVLTLSDLLYALMLESANDAAVAIALHVSGSVEAFAEEMNVKAQEIGMKNSHFANPNGLQADGHFSTARDLSSLMRFAMQNPMFAEITATRTKTISAPDGKTRYLANHNKLLRLCEDCIGGKTGFTKTAGRCLVSVAEKEGKRLICTTLGAPDDWQDHISLYDYGFSQYERRTLAEAGELQEQIPLISGKVSEIRVANTESVTISVRSQDRVEVVIETPRFTYAPIREGETVGQAVFNLNGTEWKRIDLVALESIEKVQNQLSFWQKLWKAIVSWFS